MNKKLFLLIILFSYSSYSQIVFEKGYFINNSNEKMECFIKNIDWRNNPTEFTYKTSEVSTQKNIGIESVKEFGLYNFSKYVRKTVEIDKSLESLDRLAHEKNPVFIEQELFLKVLVEGQANLYVYQEGDLKNSFTVMTILKLNNSFLRFIE